MASRPELSGHLGTVARSFGTWPSWHILWFSALITTTSCVDFQGCQPISKAATFSQRSRLSVANHYPLTSPAILARTRRTFLAQTRSAEKGSAQASMHAGDATRRSACPAPACDTPRAAARSHRLPAGCRCCCRRDRRVPRHGVRVRGGECPRAIRRSCWRKRRLPRFELSAHAFSRPTVPAGKSTCSRYSRNIPVPISTWSPPAKVACTRTVRPSNGKSTR